VSARRSGRHQGGTLATGSRRERARPGEIAGDSAFIPEFLNQPLCLLDHAPHRPRGHDRAWVRVQFKAFDRGDAAKLVAMHLCARAFELDPIVKPVDDGVRAKQALGVSNGEGRKRSVFQKFLPLDLLELQDQPEQQREKERAPSRSPRACHLPECHQL